MVIPQQPPILVDGLRACSVPQGRLTLTDVELVELAAHFAHLHTTQACPLLGVVLPIVDAFVLLAIVNHLRSRVAVQRTIERSKLIQLTRCHIQTRQGFPRGLLIGQVLPLDQVQRIHGRRDVQLGIARLHEHKVLSDFLLVILQPLQSERPRIPHIHLARLLQHTLKLLRIALNLLPRRCFGLLDHGLTFSLLDDWEGLLAVMLA